MNRPMRSILIVTAWIGAWSAGYASANAQSPRPGALGGYGGAVGLEGGMGMGGGPIIPYGGSFGGFMPFRMGGGGSLSFQPRRGPEMETPRPSFKLSPMTGGMSSMSGVRAGSSLDFPGNPGIGGLGGSSMGGMGSTPTGMGMGVGPPSFGYPFRQPPSLIAPASPGIGMSM